jgi:hypothetical protein
VLIVYLRTIYSFHHFSFFFHYKEREMKHKIKLAGFGLQGSLEWLLFIEQGG